MTAQRFLLLRLDEDSAAMGLKVVWSQELNISDIFRLLGLPDDEAQNLNAAEVESLAERMVAGASAEAALAAVKAESNSLIN